LKGKDLLIEIGVEEIPSPYMEPAISFIKSKLPEIMEEMRIRYDKFEIFSTNRRFVLFFKNLDEYQKPREVEIIGPPAKISFNPDGSLSQVGLGFAKKYGFSPGSLKIIKKEKGEYLAGIKMEKGKHIKEVLPSLLNLLIGSIPFKKTMRWGKEIKFARPIRWLLVIYGNRPLKLDLGWIRSSDLTFGNRLLYPKKIRVKSVREYFALLKRSGVILSEDDRRKSLIAQIKRVRKKNGWEISVKEELIKRIIFSVETPHIFAGRFDEKFLELPPEIIKGVLENQVSVFTVMKGEKILPYFIGFSNNRVNKNIVKGYEKVVTARLEDALFYRDEDLKKPIEEHLRNTGRIVFHERLGSLRDKVERVKALALFLGEKLFPELNPKLIEKSAILSHFDHATRLGIEFPEHCGAIGKWLGGFYNLEDEVRWAIYEQYLPYSSGDPLPTTPLGILLAICNRIETICSFFYVNEKPTGSEDPYGVRRAAITLIEIIKSGIDVPLKPAIEKALSIWGNGSLLEEIHTFIRERFKNMLLGEGIPVEVIEAFLEREDSLLKARKKILAFYQFSQKDSESAEAIVVGFKRLHNILESAKNEEIPEFPSEDLFQKEEERELWKNSVEGKANLEKMIEMEKFEEIFEYYSKIAYILDRFFKEVFVMVEDDKIRKNRLSLIKFVSEQYKKMANFYKIPTKKFTGG
jgi:glycyl-tRNA synthetase beta chain